MGRRKWKQTVVPYGQASERQRELLEAAWYSGELSFLLTPSQQDSHRKIRRWQRKGDGRVYALDISRRWGKSVLCVLLAFEQAIQNAGHRIVYIAPTYEMVRKIILPLVAEMTQSCPPRLQPEWVKSENTYRFPNGSSIELIGLDVRPDGARGTGVDWVVLDEAAFFQNLEYMLVSVLYPQLLGRPHARIVAASTPPKTPAHYWTLTLVPECIGRNAHDKKTLDDADQYSQEEIDYFYSLMPGGREGVAARREYKAEHIADDSLVIVPEFRAMQEHLVCEVKPPTWRDCYVAMDPGYHDLTAVLFAYWHFDKGALVIEDEIAEPRLNSRDIADRIKAKEAKLWKDCRRRSGTVSHETKPNPYLRFSDTEPRLLSDLAREHGLLFIPTQKDNLEAQVDQVRVAVQQGRILIHPRCKRLIAHLQHGIWKKNKRGHLFDREDDEGLKHFDLIAALVYLWRNVNKKRNPTPPLEKFVCGDLRADERPKGSKWQQEGPRLRRIGQNYLVKTGRLRSA